uniref:Uncharacterized protein n=1 Tax=uncultured bacterium contig00062 TaxID=1181545 RepID=A0A806KRA7_9BACT|nr:hypothetical protein [uncultured bacterium contig00062]
MGATNLSFWRIVFHAINHLLTKIGTFSYNATFKGVFAIFIFSNSLYYNELSS